MIAQWAPVAATIVAYVITPAALAVFFWVAGKEAIDAIKGASDWDDEEQ